MSDQTERSEVLQRVERARELLGSAERIAVVGHERPDGDSIGSMLGLTLALQARGQHAVAVAGGGVPSRFAFLPGADQTLDRFPEGEHLVVAVDSADGDRLSAKAPGQIAMNIDHHPTNTEYATINLVFPTAAATTQVLYQLASELELPVNQPVAASLLAGLITDTNGFRTPSVTPEVLGVAAALIEHGADLSTLYQRVLAEHSFIALRYWGAGLSTLELEGQLAWASLRLEDRKRIGYPGEDDADLVEMLGTIREAKVALIFVEQRDGRVKVSWRARQGVDVSAVAAGFGGGGHQLAAGAVVQGDLEQVIQQVVSATQLAMEGDAA